MAKIIEYPNASFKAAQTMADAVDSLGGSCSIEMCAQKMGNKVSGAFTALISACQKFKLISQKSGQLSTSELYREIKLAYTDEEKMNHLISSFLAPPVFSRLYDRFKGREVPISMLDKMLIKEYDVDENAASRIKRYFIEGAKAVGLLNAQNQLITFDLTVQPIESEETPPSELQIIDETPNNSREQNNNVISISDLDEYVFHIMGPGINSRIAIREEEDFLILEAMIKKIKKKFNYNS